MSKSTKERLDPSDKTCVKNLNTFCYLGKKIEKKKEIIWDGIQRVFSCAFCAGLFRHSNLNSLLFKNNSQRLPNSNFIFEDILCEIK